MTKYNNEKSCMPPPASPGDAPPAPAGGESVQTAAMAAVPEGTPPAEAEVGGVLPAEAGISPPIDDEVSVAAAAGEAPAAKAPLASAAGEPPAEAGREPWPRGNEAAGEQEGADVAVYS